MFRFKFQNLFSPDDAPGAGVPHGVAGDVSIMGEGEETSGDASDDTEGAEGEEEAPAGKPRVESFNEDEPAEEKAETEEEPDDEEEKPEGERTDEEVFQGRPTLTDVKAKYPKIFKEFPDLREVLFREGEFSKRFGSVEEAEDAMVKAGSFGTIEAALLGGDSSPIIEQLGANAPEALASVVDNFLPQVLKHSQDLYLRATMPVIEQFLHTAYTHGKNTGDANLMRSAQHAANFIFGKPEIPDPARRNQPRGPHPAEQKLEQERKEWADTRFRETSAEISAGIDQELEADIVKGLDPDKKLSQRQRASLIKEIKDEIDATLGKDEAFKRQMRSLWQRAGTAGYPRDQRASIKSAFLARAKALVPSVRTKLKGEWFGQAEKGRPDGAKAPVREVAPQGKPELGKKRFVAEAGRPAAGAGPKRPPAPKDVDYARTSDLDLIEGRFTRRR
jgi:hypothetical protein